MLGKKSTMRTLLALPAPTLLTVISNVAISFGCSRLGPVFATSSSGPTIVVSTRFESRPVGVSVLS